MLVVEFVVIEVGPPLFGDEFVNERLYEYEASVIGEGVKVVGITDVAGVVFLWAWFDVFFFDDVEVGGDVSFDFADELGPL